MVLRRCYEGGTYGSTTTTAPHPCRVFGDEPYRQRFGLKHRLVCFVAPDAARRDTLRRWCEQELTDLEREPYGALFRFTAADPATAAPVTFCEAPCWVVPFQSDPVPLLDIEPQPGVEQPVGTDATGTIFRAAGGAAVGVQPARIESHFMPQADMLRFYWNIGEDVGETDPERELDDVA